METRAARPPTGTDRPREAPREQARHVHPPKMRVPRKRQEANCSRVVFHMSCFSHGLGISKCLKRLDDQICQVETSAKDCSPVEQTTARHVAGGWSLRGTSRWDVLEPSPLSAATRRQLSASEMPRGGFHSVQSRFSENALSCEFGRGTCRTAY